MRVVVLALLLSGTLSASAQTVTGLAPSRGVVFDETYVSIRGTDLMTNPAFCSNVGTCPTQPCPVSVSFGDRQARVLNANPQVINVAAPPQPAGTVDVMVQIAGKPLITLSDAFTYDERAIIDGQRYLLPITPRVIDGALGSRWETLWTLHNDSAYLLVPKAPGAIEVAAGQTSPVVIPPNPLGGDGAFIEIPEALDESVAMQLRVRDVSRSDLNFGTEIPIIPESAFASKARLIDVPTEARYRSTLRIYGVSESPLPATVRILDEDFTQIDAFDVALHGSGKQYPSYAQIDPITSAVRASGHARVQVIVEGPIVWAFLSVTNNTTQQVTTITPMR